jgi:hypothetical protein
MAVRDYIKIDNDGTHYFLNGKEVGRKEYERDYPPERFRGTTGAAPLPDTPGAWRNFFSDALAVHPKQIKRAEEDARARGVPTEFEPESGRPQFRDRDHRRRYMKAYGVHDNNGGYGDG